jgi:uncharacterized protein (DUF427 family)
MGLTTGTGPFSRAPAGTWNFEVPAPGRALYVEPTPKRVRAVLGGQTVADSVSALLVLESGLQPVYYFPLSDVRRDVLEPSERRTWSSSKGEASYYDVRLENRTEADVAWCHQHPPAGARAITGHVGFDFHRMDRWFEEDQEVFEHPRDPYHRIDVYPSSRQVRVSLEGEVLAESRRALALFESNLPVRWYLPPADVSARLVPSETVTVCGYKGRSGYHGVELATGRLVPDVVWHYTDPLPEGAAVKDLLCFFNERVDIDLDGERQPRPETPWSRGAREGEA